MDRRQFLRASLLGASLPLLHACGDDKKPGPATSASDIPSGTTSLDPKTTPLSLVGEGAAPGLIIADAEAETVVGDTRYAFGLLAPDRTRIVGANVTVFTGYDEDSPPVQIATAKPLVEGTEKLGLYVAPLKFAKAGSLLVAIRAETKDDGAKFAGGTTVSVGAKSVSPLPGQPAINVPTPTTGNPRHANPLCSRKPVCSMHSLSLRDALANGKPTVITFAAPAFCVSEVCGPVVDIVQKQANRLGARMNFIHVEAYLQPQTSGGQPQLAAALEAWKFEAEPWTYVINGKGIVSSRLSGAFGGEELAAALKKVGG